MPTKKQIIERINERTEELDAMQSYWIKESMKEPENLLYKELEDGAFARKIELKRLKAFITGSW